MCGIVGYVGGQDAAPVILEGLARLEYRGYDSAGIAVARLRRHQGRPSGPVGSGTSPAALPEAARRARSASATRGGRPTGAPPTPTPTRIPTRPAGSPSCTTGSSTTPPRCGRGSTADGVEFASETDTEVLAHLVARSDGRHPRGRGRSTRCRQIDGTYGLAVLHADHPDRIVVARNGSPLIIGVGEREMHVASDLAALVRYTTPDRPPRRRRAGHHHRRGASDLHADDRRDTHKSPTTVDVDRRRLRRRRSRRTSC